MGHKDGSWHDEVQTSFEERRTMERGSCSLEGRMEWNGMEWNGMAAYGADN
jgi:hypothetical protein